MNTTPPESRDPRVFNSSPRTARGDSPLDVAEGPTLGDLAMVLMWLSGSSKVDLPEEFVEVLNRRLADDPEGIGSSSPIAVLAENGISNVRALHSAFCQYGALLGGMALMYARKVADGDAVGAAEWAAMIVHQLTDITPGKWLTPVTEREGAAG